MKSQKPIIDMKARVIALLVKRGNNPETAQQLVESQLDWAMKAFPDARPHILADICRITS